MRLICFGDSWTAGNGIEEDNKYGNDLMNIGNKFFEKLRMNNCWPRWLSNKLDCTYVSFACEGNSNSQILNDIEKVIQGNVLKNDDVIIVMLTFPYRGKLNPIDMFEKMENILNPYIHFFFNAFYPMFKDVEYNNIPECFIEPNYSMMDLLLDYELKNPETEPLWEFGKRRHWSVERNQFEGGGHPNLLGYKIIADYIFEKIKDKKNITKPIIKHNKII